MPGHLQHTAANIDADLQHTAVKSHVRCDPTVHANKYLLQNITINPQASDGLRLPFVHQFYSCHYHCRTFLDTVDTAQKCR